jgi:hypothetical protein
MDESLDKTAQRLLDWIKDNLAYVSKMDKQMTLKQAEDLITRYEKKEIAETLEEMDNYKPLTSKYRSVSMTVRKWIELKRKKQQYMKGNKKRSDGLWTYDEALTYTQRKYGTLDHTQYFEKVDQPGDKKPLWREK